MAADSIGAYERHAQQFLSCRDRSKVGIGVVSRWARSLKPNACVLEIACGGGLPVSRTLIDVGLRLWAIDASPSLLSVFNRRFPEVPTQCASVLESDFFNRSFDGVICIGLLFLLRKTDQIEVLDRVSNFLQPGASFLFTAPLETGTWPDVNSGHTCLSLGREEYEEALVQSGYGVLGHCQDRGKNNYYEAEKLPRKTAGNVV